MAKNHSSTVFMEKRIVIAFNAMKSQVQELKDIITEVRMQESLIRDLNSIKFLGVLDQVLHPMGFHFHVGPKSFIGSHARAIEEDVSRKVDACLGILQHSAEDFESIGVDIEIKIVVGAPLKKIVVQEIGAFDATWAILTWQLRKDLRFYLQHIPCKVAQAVNSLSLQILRPYYLDKNPATSNHKVLYSLSKPVLPLPAVDNDIDKHCDIEISAISSEKSSDTPQSGLIPESLLFSQDDSGSSHHQEPSGYCEEKKYLDSSKVMQKETSEQDHPEEPAAAASEISEKYTNFEIVNTPDKFSQAKAESECDNSPSVTSTYEAPQIYPDACVNLSSLEIIYSVIQNATDNFSLDNLIEEGDHGVVYKGQLEDGHPITAKVKKGANAQCCAEFQYRAYVLSTVRHCNIERLVGYSCKENLNILVYDYICNKSLEWHLFDNTEQVLEWHHRRAIAVGTAKGLLFLHKQWWGSPLIHRDIRPQNILLTEGFVPLLNDCGLAEQNTNKCDLLKRNHDSFIYLAPEFADSGVFSMKTDIYALGIVLLQLLSGRKAVNSANDDHKQSLKQWALPSIQMLDFDELVDPRLGKSYCSRELYNMAKAAYLCVQTNPEVRPTAEEVLHLLEGTNGHLAHTKSYLYPIILSSEVSLS